MSRDENLYLIDICDCCHKILEYSKQKTYGDFCNDQKTVDAILHNLLVIGEASKNLSSKFLDKHPNVAWKKIKGLRDIIAHQYFGLDYPMLWDIISTKIPELHRILSKCKN